MTTILHVDNVTLRFGGVVANSGVSLEVQTGEILGLIGPNGAGKSTLFNLIAGVYKPNEGSIRHLNRDITNLSPAQRCKLGIGRTFQVVKSFEAMTVLENVMVGAFLRHPKHRSASAAAERVLEMCELNGRTYSMASQLTPPEKRRLEVARALAAEPKILLLDEVLTGLTPSEAHRGVELIRRVRETGVTIIMVEHVMEVVMPLIDRAVVLNLGKVFAEGCPDEIVRNREVVAAYLGEKYHARRR